MLKVVTGGEEGGGDGCKFGFGLFEFVGVDGSFLLFEVILGGFFLVILGSNLLELIVQQVFFLLEEEDGVGGEDFVGEDAEEGRLGGAEGLGDVEWCKERG